MADEVRISRLREERDLVHASAVAAEARLARLDDEIARAERAGDARLLAGLRKDRAAVATGADTARESHARLRVDALDGLREHLKQSPEAIVGRFSDRHPIVLLPVRLETKFTATRGGAELQVRIFPDDVSVAPPPAAITEEEQADAAAYWRARVDAHAHPADADRQRAYEGAWIGLATRHGAYRAGYLVTAMTPSNPGADAASLNFNPLSTPVEPPHPRADALPDRFIILTYAGGQQIDEAVGEAIPDDIALAPDPSQAETWLARDAATGKLEVPEALRWLVDFEVAVSVGMAVRIPLRPPFATRGFDRVLAIGVRGSSPPDQAPAALERLLSKHRNGQGLGIVRSGTPTNNTDTAMSGWQPASGDTDQLFAIADAPPDISPQPGLLGAKDGWRLARLLGLSTEFARRLPNAASSDIAEAIAMNRAMAPGTLDDFVGEFLKTSVAPETAAELHDFFVDWVSGRGFYPALRVGRQPYGIVVTSAWERWAYPDTDPRFGRGSDFSPRLAELLRLHRPRWEALGKEAAHAAQPAADPMQRLLTIIGLLASSSDFVSRKAVSDQYVHERLRFGGAEASAIQQWFFDLTRLRGESLAASQLPVRSGPIDPMVGSIAFLDHTDGWELPIVDGDPKVPLSERVPIRPFDEVRNYLHWLGEAPRADIVAQRFTGAGGASVSPPSALLYVMLRHSLMTALETSALDTASKFGSALFEVVDRDPPIINIAAEQHVLRRDYLGVDAATLGLAAKPTTLVDWALESARLPGLKPATTARAAEVHEAVTALAPLPTARLERLFAEHIDLCSYRLDAWITGLYAQRLEQLRSQDQTHGLYLGAYGWVENLRPVGDERTAIAVEAVPAALRKDAGPRIFEERRNGGYVHAPSLMQAATASVLRNAYLSHADALNPLPFAVNLSSARMREATAIAGGVRNGQPLPALLGYQIERGLHERHPGIELDRYIYVLRDRFPLLSGQLTDPPPGISATSIEARNVVHGLDLLQSTAGKAFPWGLADLPAAGSPAALAIAAEVDRARDTLDAVSDLLLSESVHQAVLANVARTKASLQALSEPEAPPEPEIIRTPRSGSVLTFRVALTLDVDAVAGWSPGLSPRSAANRQLNHWLARHLPDPAKVQWSVADGAAAPVIQSLGNLAIEPIDLVLMSGDRLGDQSSELERLAIGQFRRANGVPDERMTRVAPVDASLDPAKILLFDFAAAGGGDLSLAKLQPLLARLRHIVTRGRAVDARDLWRAADMTQVGIADPAGAASGDPRLVAFKDLTDRLDAVIAGLIAAGTALKSALAAIAPLRLALEGDDTTISDPAWPPALDDLRTALDEAQKYGIAEALPAEGLTVSAVLADRLAGQGAAVSALIDQRAARAQTLRTTAFSDPLPAEEPERTKEVARRNEQLRQAYLECARAVFGPAYTILPLFRLHAPQAGEIAQALAAPPADAVAVEEWIGSASRVRPPLAELTWAMAVTRWADCPIADPSLLQLPFQPGTPWIGGKISPDQARGEWLSLLLLEAAALGKPVASGLMIDDWTETVPTVRETTGVAFNFNRPNAVAPQALLVAVPPVLRGHWEWADLVGAVHEGLDLAKVRAVEPEQLLDRKPGQTAPHGDYFQTLPAILSEFSTSRFSSLHYVGAAISSLALDPKG